MKAIRAVGALALAFASAFASNTIAAQQPGVHRTDIEQHELSIPGWEVVRARVSVIRGCIP